MLVPYIYQSWVLFLISALLSLALHLHISSITVVSKKSEVIE